MAKTVQDLLQEKGDTVYSIHPDSSVYDAIKLMAEESIGSLLVIDGDRVDGIISERDYARKVILQGRSSKQTKVSEIMTRKVLYVGPEQQVEVCLALMNEKRIRHLPVVQDGKVIGLVSTGDVVRGMVSEKEFVIEQLVKYMAGH